jgi:hypothetical protein
VIPKGIITWYHTCHTVGLTGKHTLLSVETALAEALLSYYVVWTVTDCLQNTLQIFFLNW